MIDITPEEILNELMMLNATVNASAFLIVEGESDKKLFQQLVNDYDCIYIYPAGTQSLVIDSIAKLTLDPKLLGTLLPTRGVIDRDYLVPLKAAPVNPAVYMSDLRDIECMMIDSDAFKSVVAEFVDWDKAKRYGIKNVSDLRSVLIDICSPVGALRFWSQSTTLNLTFKNIDLTKCLDFNRRGIVGLDSHGLIIRLQGAQAKEKKVSIGDLEKAKKLCSLDPYFSSPLLQCRGHDLTVVLAAMFRKCCGNGAAREIEEDEIERLLRVGFPKFWHAYTLIANLKGWLTTIGLGSKLA